ncbi:MAG: hypothetical protein M0009_16340 [Deltaproteobacteria bacterium]|nr:hypothetical protein [Deltaproteobacteria bacterium]
MDTFIFVHDSNIITEYERTGKFAKRFGRHYKYVFLGNQEVTPSEKVIVARSLPENIEHLPKLVTFTGWYALVRNHLLTGKYNLLLEYDVVLNDKFERIVNQAVKQSRTKEVFSFLPIDKDFMFYEYLHEFLGETGIEVFKEKRQRFIETHHQEKWMGSSNSLWKKETLTAFVNWFAEFLHSDFKDYSGIGHTVERALTVFCVLHGIKYNFIGSVLKHYFLDSHQTQAVYNQGIQKDYREHIRFLAEA